MIWGAAAGLMTTPLIHIMAQRCRDSAVRQRTTGWVFLAAGSVAIGTTATLIRTSAASAIYVTALAAILVAAAVDATEQRLPNILTIGSGAFAFAALTAISVATGTGSPWRAVACGAIFGGWILVGALVIRDGYGLGDVKLAAACGILAGWLSWTTLAAAVVATQVMITLVLIHAKSRGRPRVPLGPAFVAGLVTAIVATGL